ncbi:tetratricopeptide repeat protein [Streptomyces sp. NPDC055078]
MEEDGPHRQNVTAVDGVAHGVIGADLHVFANGSPLYLLRRWSPPPRADRSVLRELPSRMLNARFAVVEFTGRGDELSALRQWRDSEPRLAARWLYGAAGQGKTRLADRLARESADAGWLVVTALHGPGTVFGPSGSQDLRAAGAPGVLLVVDYADRWPLTHLAWLFSNALLRRGVPARILLLARTADSWPAVGGRLAALRAATSEQLLGPLPGDASARAEMFLAARAGFAELYGYGPDGYGPDGPPPAAPELLARPEFGLTLAVHMLALVTVDATRTGAPTPAGTAGLTVYLLDREHLHWARVHGDRSQRLGEPDFVTPPSTMNRVVFVAALTGALPRELGERAWGVARGAGDAPGAIASPATGAVDGRDGSGHGDYGGHGSGGGSDTRGRTSSGHGNGGGSGSGSGSGQGNNSSNRNRNRNRNRNSTNQDQVLADHARIYPPTEPGALPFPTVLEPLYPDRLAEDFLALTVPGHDGDYPAQSWAVPTARSLVAAGSPWRARAVTFLANAAERWPHLGPGLLHGLLAETPELAVAGGGGTLATLAGLPGAEPWLLERIEAALPRGRRLDLDVGVAALTARLTEHRLAAAAGPLEQAVILDTLADRLNHAGLVPQARDTGERAVALAREAVARRGADEPTLAGALLTLYNVLGETEEYLVALAVAEELVVRNRSLAAKSLRRYGTDLAASLDSLGNALDKAGRRREALAASREAVTVRRRVAMARRPVRALAARISGRRRSPDSAERVIGDYRMLSDAPNADLASALNILGRRLRALGQSEESLPYTAEAIRIRRALAERYPGAYDHDLARSLSDYGERLGAVRRYDEALAATGEALGVYRRLAEVNPGVFGPGVALSLQSYGWHLSDAGRHAEAVEYLRQSVGRLRGLHTQVPDEQDASIAITLDLLGTQLAELGRHEEALAASEESVAIGRRLADTGSPRMYQHNLAISLNQLASRLLAVRRPGDALAVSAETVSVRRRLASADRELFEPDLFTVLADHTSRLVARGRRAEALSACEEALEIHGRLPASGVLGTEPSYVSLLDSRSLLHSVLGRSDDAVRPAAEAVRLLRRARAAGPGAYGRSLPVSLTALAARLTEAGRAPEAVGVIEEAIGLLREQAVTPVDRSWGALVNALVTATLVYGRLARYGDALAAGAEATAVQRRLADADPDTYGPWLGAVLVQWGQCLYWEKRWDASLAAAREAVASLRKWAAVDAEMIVPYLAIALNNVGVLLTERGGLGSGGGGEARGAGEAGAAPEARDGGEVRETQEAQEAREVREAREAQEAREARDTGETETAREAREAQEAQEAQEAREARDAGETQTARETQEARQAREAQEARQAREAQDAGETQTAPEAGDALAALEALEEAVRLRRELAAAHPDIHPPLLAGTLIGLSDALAECGRADEALGAARESVALFRASELTRTPHHEPRFALALSSLSIRLWERGEAREARALSAEAVAVRRRLAGSPDHSRVGPDVLAARAELLSWLAGAAPESAALAPFASGVLTGDGLASNSPHVLHQDMTALFLTAAAASHGAGPAHRTAAARLRHLTRRGDFARALEALRALPLPLPGTTGD